MGPGGTVGSSMGETAEEGMFSKQEERFIEANIVKGNLMIIWACEIL
jgi:hypothetical protein